MNNLALFGHIVSGFVLFAGMVLAAAGWHLARSRTAPSEVALLLKLCWIGAMAVAAATVSVLGFGLWLVDLQERRLSDTWISWAISLLLVAMVAGIVGGQRPKKARLLAQRLSREGGAGTEELRRLLDDRASAVLNYLAAGCILVILFLMVFKPQLGFFTIERASNALPKINNPFAATLRAIETGATGSRQSGGA